MFGSIGCLADGVEYITNAANNILHAVKYSFIADLHRIQIHIKKERLLLQQPINLVNLKSNTMKTQFKYKIIPMLYNINP